MIRHLAGLPFACVSPSLYDARMGDHLVSIIYSGRGWYVCVDHGMTHRTAFASAREAAEALAHLLQRIAFLEEEKNDDKRED